MKVKSLILALCGAFVSLTASAQFFKLGEGWNKVYVNYNPVTAEAPYSDYSLSTGFSAGFNHAKQITESMPLFVEAGLGFHYATGTEEESGNESGQSWSAEYKTTSMSLFVPINVTYKYEVNEKISVAPYLGLRLRYNLSIEGEQEVFANGEKLDDESYKEDWFEEKDMGKDNTANRFMFGYQIGVNAILKNKYSVGIEYEGYFSELRKKVDLSGWSVGVGMYF